MSGDGGRKGDVPKPLSGSGGNPPLYEGGGGDGGGHPGHMKFPHAPIEFDARNLDTGELVRIVEKREDGIYLDGQGNEYRPHPHRLGVVPV